MADYAKFKVAELQAQLKERSLPHTGKKDELIARLQEDDQKKTTGSDAAPAPAAAAQEDEIDWEEDEAAQPAAATTATASTTDAPTETAVPEAKAEMTEANPSNSTEAAASAPPTQTEPTTAPEPPSEEQLDTALQARLARIDKFVNKADPADVARAEEEKASLLRLAKFKDSDNATAITNPKGMLDSVLPEKRQKRGRGEGGDADRGGKRRRGGGGGGGRGASEGVQRAPRTEVRNGGGGGGNASWMSDKDREAARRRAERFAKPTA